jgi:hypothetical protein
MATVVRRDTAKAVRLAEGDKRALIVAVGPVQEKAHAGVAEIGICVARSGLASKLEQAIARALGPVVSAPLPPPSVVRVASRKTLDRLGALVFGRFAVVPITAKNLGRVGEIVEGLRRAGVSGVQLVWDGQSPSRAVAEPKVFAILERARATPSDPPVVLSSNAELVESLRILARREAGSVG